MINHEYPPVYHGAYVSMRTYYFNHPWMIKVIFPMPDLNIQLHN